MISTKSTYLTFLVLAGILVSPGYAQYIQQGAKLAGSGAVSTFAGEGSAVAVSGDGNTAVLVGNGESAAWVFTFTNDAWTQQGAKLPVTGCSGPASAGCSAALSGDGNTLIVGAPFDNSGVGSTWVFVRANNGTWSPRGKLLAIDVVGAAQQGYSVALSSDGNTALVGGALDASGAGAIWVFNSIGGGLWSQQGPKLVGTGAVGPAWQGFSVSLSADGGTALSGGPFDANFAGATWVFAKNANGGWSQQGPKLVGTGAVGPAFQGQSVSISAGGSTALVGGPQDNQSNRLNVGAAWVFKRAGDGSWSQDGGKLVAADSMPFPRQGQSVSISGDGNTAVVGAPFEGGSTGAAWIYTRSAAGIWSQQDGKLTGAGAVGAAAEQGQSVAISTDGSTILAGGPGDNNDLGAAWTFRKAHFSVTGPSAATVGVPVTLTLSLLDSNNAVVSGYGGTLHFTSTDSNAVLPPDATLISSGQNFTVTLKTIGNQTVTVSDSTRGSVTGTTSAITVGVSVGPATHFNLSVPASAITGIAFSATVTALNASNQIVTDYGGTVRIASTDAGAVLPGNFTLSNGVESFPVTLNTAGAQTITATDTGNPAITGTSNPVPVAATTVPPVPLGVGPSSGNTATAAFNFSFNDPHGAEDFDVVNILINNSLDGRNACYLAYSQPAHVLYLVGDNGALDPLIVGSVNTNGSVSNSQCTVSWGVSVIAVTRNTINLAINITFKPSFAGNKVIYLAARDLEGNNSGWQALGVWQVPGTATSIITVTGMTAARGTGLGPAPFTFSFSDTRGNQDLGVANILVNDSVDGRHACYLAFARSSNVLYLLNDTGDGLLPAQSLAAGGSIANSQCTVTWGASAVTAGGNNLTLNLNIGFHANFAGNRIFYLAARDVNEANNTGWQAMGTWTVQ